MLLIVLTILPLIGIISIILLQDYDEDEVCYDFTHPYYLNNPDPYDLNSEPPIDIYSPLLRLATLFISVINLVMSLIIWIFFNNSSKNFQFVEQQETINYYDFYLGIDGLSIFFLLLTTIITPIAIISNWKSIEEKIIYFLSIMLLLETLLLLIYAVLDLLMFYIFFESILAPLFILIGIFGSIEKQRASFYFFLYTFLGSLFMLLSIITVSYLSGCTDVNIISRNDFVYITQLFLFLGIFIAFAVKTPVIYLNGWLLKAHVESPLSGSILLAAIVLKLSLYGIFRLILILSPKAYITYTYVIFTIGVITIIYASLSTLRTIDIKELIAYSSVSHAAVYFIGVFSNVIQGIIGAICLGLAHGFVSSGLFIIAGGVLYDRSGTRLISSYKGLVQAMPLLAILFFILCLGNCGAPLTINFVGEFMSLYGVFERLPLAGALASSSIVFSAAFTIYLFNRIIFGGSLFYRNWEHYPIDLNLREYSILLILVLFTVFLGIFPSIITDGLNYVTQGLLYSFNGDTTTITLHDVNKAWDLFFIDDDYPTPERIALYDLHNNIMFYLSIILFSVTWIIISIKINNLYNSDNISKYVKDHTVLYLKNDTRFMLPNQIDKLATYKRPFTSSRSRKADPLTTTVVATVTLSAGTLQVILSMLTATALVIYGVVNEIVPVDIPVDIPADIPGDETMFDDEYQRDRLDRLTRLLIIGGLIGTFADHFETLENNIDNILNNMPRDDVIGIIRMVGPIAVLIDVPNDLTSGIAEVNGLRPIFPAISEWIDTFENDPNTSERVIDIIEDEIWPNIRDAGNSAQGVLRACFNHLGLGAGLAQWFE